MNFEVLTWESTFTSCHDLFQKIRIDDFIPDVIVGIARGGWIPGRLLADFFMLKLTANIKVEAYHKIGDEEIKAEITQDLKISLKGKNVLIVDDIADSGKSLEVVIKNLQKRDPSSIKTATLYYKEKSKIVPDYYLFLTEAWVIFAWEFYETISELSAKWDEEGLEASKIKTRLVEIGIPENMVVSYSNQHKML